MAESNTEIANLALSHLGVGKEIANLETEDSEEANACRRFYNTARDATLRDFPAHFATKMAALVLVATDPSETNSEWGYSYRYPGDCIRVRRILTGVRKETGDSRAAFKIGRDSDGVLIYTDEQNAEIEYTYRETDPTRYPADFVMAFSWRLASYVAPRLTRGDPFKLVDRSIQMYVMEIRSAEAAMANEEQPDLPADSEFERQRE